MKIKDITVESKVQFEDIKLGVVFRLDDEYYMRTNIVAGLNAVCLENGQMVSVPLTATITLMDAELVVKGEVL